MKRLCRSLHTALDGFAHAHTLPLLSERFRHIGEKNGPVCAYSHPSLEQATHSFFHLYMHIDATCFVWKLCTVFGTIA